MKLELFSTSSKEPDLFATDNTPSIITKIQRKFQFEVPDEVFDLYKINRIQAEISKKLQFLYESLLGKNHITLTMDDGTGTVVTINAKTKAEIESAIQVWLEKIKQKTRQIRDAEQVQKAVETECVKTVRGKVVQVPQTFVGFTPFPTEHNMTEFIRQERKAKDGRV